jgi:hypothetical protein
MSAPLSDEIVSALQQIALCDVLTEEQAGILLRPAKPISPATLATWRVRGGGPPYVKVGGSVGYRKAAVLRWIESRERLTTSDRQEVA